MNPDEPKNYWQHNSPDDAPVAHDEPEATPEVPAEPKLPGDDQTVTWTAQEYVHLDKNVGWYVAFVFVVLGLIALDIFIFRSWTFSILVVVMAVAVVVYSRRPPRIISYILSGNQGLYVGERLYHFSEFKSFGLIRDAEHYSIMLIPTKRFSPGVSVYFPEEAGEKIVDILGQRLPMEELKLDIIDVVVRKLRL